ncbi:MAG: histone deacetylase family protein, partial [Chloroflexota bacterium]
MQVVYSPAHLAHDITSETFMGLSIPANEVAERAERIRNALTADGGFQFTEPTDHGESPITAVHDAGLVRFLEVAWSELRRQGISRPFLSADTYPNRSMFEGMSDDAVAGLVREPVHAGGRAGFWGLDSAAPLVAGTYSAARAAVDVALTAADLVLAGQPAAYGLCRPPGHHAARSMYGGYCFLNNAAIAADAIVRATGERVAILDVDYHHGNGTQDIFYERGDVLYVSIHADPVMDYPYYWGHADERGKRAGHGANLNLPLPRGTDWATYQSALLQALDRIETHEAELLIVSYGADTYEGDPISHFNLKTSDYAPMAR